MVAFTLAPEFGYTIFSAIVSTIVVQFLGYKAGSQRKVAQVPLPFLYADPAECNADHKKYIYNCYQRAHQNTLEVFPAYLVTLLLGGLEYPIAAAALGAVWSVGRILFYIGYTSGVPSKRSLGGVGYIGSLGLLGLTARTAFDLVMSAQA